MSINIFSELEINELQKRWTHSFKSNIQIMQILLFKSFAILS